MDYKTAKNKSTNASNYRIFRIGIIKDEYTWCLMNVRYIICFVFDKKNCFRCSIWVICKTNKHLRCWDQQSKTFNFEWQKRNLKISHKKHLNGKIRSWGKKLPSNMKCWFTVIGRIRMLQHIRNIHKYWQFMTEYLLPEINLLLVTTVTWKWKRVQKWFHVIHVNHSRYYLRFWHVLFFVNDSTRWKLKVLQTTCLSLYLTLTLTFFLLAIKNICLNIEWFFISSLFANNISWGLWHIKCRWYSTNILLLIS